MTTKTKAAKTPNYTAEQVAEMRSLYTANPTKETVAMLAAKFGKAEKSVIAKLSREGVYKKATYTTKNGETPIKKEDLASQIGAKLGMTEEQAESLAKANKTVLKKVAEALGVTVKAVMAEDAESDAEDAESDAEPETA